MASTKRRGHITSSAATTPTDPQAIKDDGLADQIKAIEQNDALPAEQSLRAIKEAIEQRYTLPAAASPPATPKASKQEGPPAGRPS